MTELDRAYLARDIVAELDRRGLLVSVPGDLWAAGVELDLSGEDAREAERIIERMLSEREPEQPQPGAGIRMLARVVEAAGGTVTVPKRLMVDHADELHRYDLPSGGVMFATRSAKAKAERVVERMRAGEL